MKNNIRVVDTPSGNTWAEVARAAAIKIAENLEYLTINSDHKLHLVLPNGDGAIVDTLTDTTLSVMPGRGWEHFDKYGLFQEGNGVMIDLSAFTALNVGPESQVPNKLAARIRLVFLRSALLRRSK